jgi:tryptophan halogenase
MKTSATPTKIKQVVILGGGTAGWLSANHLAKKLLPLHPDGVKVLLVESANIPTIGVGEGTVPAIRNTLQYLGISETELLQQCDATFKQSIKFVNWQPPLANGKPHTYHHLFDYPNIVPFDGLPYWLLGCAGEHSFAESFSFQAHLCDKGLAPKLITQPEYQGLSNYAYHFDAAKFGQLLARHAIKNLGVEHRVADVAKVVTDQAGNISALNCADGTQIEGDFFVDCSGFQSLLLGQTMQVPFIDKSHMLFADTALAIQVPYVEGQDAIPCSTIATAQTAGWIWDIGLSTRRGVGHVYSSQHISHQDAEQQLRSYLGGIGKDIEARKIAMRTGYHEVFWQGNCAAIGLSQGFVEPLEATGLLLFDVSARMLAEQFPQYVEDMEMVANRFNNKLRHAWDKVLDFIKLHYFISKRNDCDFWRDNREVSSVSQSLLDDLNHWRHQLPSHYDFTDISSVFNLENYLYVLYGMNFHTDISANSYRFDQTAKAKQEFEHMYRLAQQAEKQLMPHRDLLKRIAQFGLQKI